MIRQNSLSGIRLDSNQVTHILDAPRDDDDEKYTTVIAAVVSPVRRRRRQQTTTDNYINQHTHNSNNNNEPDVLVRGFVSPTRQPRIPLTRSNVHNNNNINQLHQTFSGLCIGQDGPETVSPQRRASPVRRTSPTRHHPAHNTPWRSRNRSSNNNQEDQEENGEDSRVENVENDTERNWLTNDVNSQQMREARNDLRRFENITDDIVSSRGRPMQMIRRLA